MRLRKRPRRDWRVEVIRGYNGSADVVIVPRRTRNPTWYGDNCLTVKRLFPSRGKFAEELALAVAEAEEKAAMLRAVK